MNVFVGCSSRETSNEYYNRIAEEIGNLIAEGKHNLIFGGSDIGLMGKVYTAVSKGTESKIFIASVKPYDYHLVNLSYSSATIYLTTNERKEAFYKMADVMLFLPGGIGTLDEIFSAIEAKRTGEHNKPIIIVNANNFFKHLLEMLNQIYDEGFADRNNSEIYSVVNSIEEAAKQLSGLANFH